MDDAVSTSISGMTCMSCVGRVKDALSSIEGAYNISVELDSGNASLQGVSKETMEEIIVSLGYGIGNETGNVQNNGFNWKDGAIWKESANNTKWCLIGCSIGEFGTLGAYSYFHIGHHIDSSHMFYLPLLILPLINGLITSVILETMILVRKSIIFSEALKTALGMSFISMLMMEIAMEITDLIFTGGELGMNLIAIPFMLIVGFLTPWPYNYWRLKKYGFSCH